MHVIKLAAVLKVGDSRKYIPSLSETYQMRENRAFHLNGQGIFSLACERNAIGRLFLALLKGKEGGFPGKFVPV